VIFIITAAI